MFKIQVIGISIARRNGFKLAGYMSMTALFKKREGKFLDFDLS
jgi:hypothetical protein